MLKLRAPDEKSSSESMPPWSAKTTCTTCGEYKPCRCSDEGNLTATLVAFAAWRKCSTCGRPSLYVDGNVRTDTAFTCRVCELRRETLGKLFSRIQPCRVCKTLTSQRWLVDGLCPEHYARLKVLALELYESREEQLLNQEAVRA